LRGLDGTDNYETLTGGGAPRPVVFCAEEVHEMMKLNAVQGGEDEVLEACRNIIGFIPEG